MCIDIIDDMKFCTLPMNLRVDAPILILQGPVTFKVSVPKVEDKPEWNLKGQTVSFTLPLTDTVSEIMNINFFCYDQN